MELLKDYRNRKKELAIFGERDDETEFLERCLQGIEEFERDVIEKTCMDGVSIRQYAKMSGFSREAVTKERKRVLSLLCRFFIRMHEEREKAIPAEGRKKIP